MPKSPTIRWPREFKGLVGETTRIYLSEDKDKLAFKVIIDKKVDDFCTNSEKDELEDRLSDLESEITDLKSSILKNESLTDNCSEKGTQITGLGRIRTCDLRRVKAPTACSAAQICPSPLYKGLNHEPSPFVPQVLSEQHFRLRKKNWLVLRND